MKTPRGLARVGIGFCAALMLACLPAMGGQAAGSPSVVSRLSIIELNITGDEFIALQNTGTTPADLSSYWLGYTSDTSGIPAPVEQLPAVSLPVGGVLLLTSGTQASCGAMYVDKLGFSLGNTAGKLALWQLQASSGPATLAITSDGVLSWGNDTQTGPDYLNTDDDKAVKTYLKDNPSVVTTSNPVWYLTSLAPSTAPAWQHGYLQDCAYMALITDHDVEQPQQQTISWLSAEQGPPFILAGSIMVGAPSSGSAPVIPAADRGLKAVQLSELLPNTQTPQTDASDEFIELYNPNAAAFDLAGFMLQTASATSSATHTYRFPAGTSIAGGSFKAFTSSQTHLSLANGGGQVWLVDPLGTTMAKSAPYGKADDGMAWVNAGTWQWTATPTPNITNKVTTVVTAGGSSKTATVNGKKVATVAGSVGTVQGASTTASQTAQTAPAASVHPLTLALVVVAALLYGAYEYRYDLANYYRQFRRNRSRRR